MQEGQLKAAEGNSRRLARRIYPRAGHTHYWVGDNVADRSEKAKPVRTLLVDEKKDMRP